MVDLLPPGLPGLITGVEDFVGSLCESESRQGLKHLQGEAPTDGFSAEVWALAGQASVERPAQAFTGRRLPQRD